MSDEIMLAKYGTRAVAFTPAGILSVAKLDLARREYNVTEMAHRKSHPTEFHLWHDYKRYAFRASHLKHTKLASIVLWRALGEFESPAWLAMLRGEVKTPKLSLVRLAFDLDAVRRALKLAEEEEQRHVDERNRA